MRKLLTAGVAALTVFGAMAPAAGAQARDWGRYGHSYYGGGYGSYGGYRAYGGHRSYGYPGYGYGYSYGRHHHHDDGTDEAIVAGIVGLAIGAALASSGGGQRRDRYDDGYRDDRGYGDDRCSVVTEWDPRSDSYIRRTRCW